MKVLLLWLLGVIVVPALVGEFTDFCPWIARKLVRRAARRIPEQDRARWEEEWLGELDSQPGRIWKLAWALWSLPVLRGASEMGRLLGAPPWIEVVQARLRAAWQRLQSRPKAPTQEPEREPVFAPPEVAQSLGLDASSVPIFEAARAPTVSADTDLLWMFRRDELRGRLLGLSDEEFIAWLAQERKDFDAYIDRKFEEYREQRGRLLGD